MLRLLRKRDDSHWKVNSSDVVYLNSLQSRRTLSCLNALSHSFWPGAVCVQWEIKLLMLSVSALLKNIIVYSRTPVHLISLFDNSLFSPISKAEFCLNRTQSLIWLRAWWAWAIWYAGENIRTLITFPCILPHGLFFLTLLAQTFFF